MKAVLISIRPKWVELIADGQKTVEIRKSRPKLETPFRCYIYQSGKNLTSTVYGPAFSKSGYVVGEFECDKIKSIDIPFPAYWRDVHKEMLAGSCLSLQQAHNYLGHSSGYGWHISALKMYDEPKKLSEFRSCNTLIDFEQGYPMPTHGIRRPPQSYMYVEELTT